MAPTTSRQLPSTVRVAPPQALHTTVVRRGTVAVLLLWAAAPIVAVAYHTVRHGGVLSGTDGPLAGPDQLFYMDLIRQSAQHLLITDHFDLRLGSAVFLHPVYLLAGLVWRAGLSLQATFWLLQLLAAPVLALGATALVTRSLRSARERAVALALGLFYLSPLVPLLAWTGAISSYHRFMLDFPAGESMPAWQLWGYPHAAMAMGLLGAALAGAAAMAARPRRRERLILAGISVAACLAGWLHPWQGAVYIVVVAALALRGRSWRLAAQLAVSAIAAGAPIVYELILTHADAAWRLESAQNAIGHFPLWTVAVALVPLLIPALAGIRTITPGPQRTVLVMWPLSALAIYFGTSQFPYHALQGLTIPLAVLAVAGWRRLPRAQVLGAGAAMLAVASGIAYEAVTFHDSEALSVAPYWFTPGERQALAYLDQAPAKGGVFAPYYIGMAVPAFTGRRTWVGQYAWTPQFAQRQALAGELAEGRMMPARARALLSSTGARFLLSDCRMPVALDGLLGPLLVRKRTFGCAAVYELRVPGSRAAAAG